MEAKFCKDEGYMQKISSVEKLELPETHAAIEADCLADCDPNDVGASMKDVMDPKVRRRLKKAECALKDKGLLEKLKHKPKKTTKKLVVLMKKGKIKMKEMLKTMTRLEVLQKTLVESGTGKALKAVKKAANEEHALMKTSITDAVVSKLKTCLNKKLFLGVKKKLKKNLKTKPSAKSKPSLKSKPSVVVKTAIKQSLKDLKKK